MKAKLIDLGRGKFNGEVEFNTIGELMNHIKSHLLSNLVDLEYHDGDRRAAVVVGGFRTVGFVVLLDARFLMANHLVVAIERDAFEPSK
jgi:hypothetical protein